MHQPRPRIAELEPGPFETPSCLALSLPPRQGTTRGATVVEVMAASPTYAVRLGTLIHPWLAHELDYVGCGKLS